jgi:hypothetical protein
MQCWPVVARIGLVSLLKKLFGLLSGKSTTLQLLLVLDQWTETLDNGGSIDSCLYGFHEGVRQSPP